MTTIQRVFLFCLKSDWEVNKQFIYGIFRLNVMRIMLCGYGGAGIE